MLMNTEIKLEKDEYLKDNVPHCSKCNTPRWFISGDFKVKCKCKCQMEEIERQEEIQKQEKLKQYLKELKDKSLLGERYKDATFDSIEIINEEHLKVVNRLKKYCEGFKEHNDGLGLYLFGTKGSGKTLLTASMLDKLNSQFIECMFTNIHKIKEELLSIDMKRQKSFLNRVTTVPVLFIDDFATESFKKNGEDNWVQDIVYDIVNTRYNNMLPIIYTSNCSLKQCLEEKGVLEKTIDRIFETTVAIKLDLPSYRTRKKENVYLVKKEIVNASYHLNTGFLSTVYLLPTLCDNGLKEEAFRILEQTETPSWLSPILMGATTMPENWDGFDRFRDSFNHYSLGAVCQFLFEYIGGIRPRFDKPGFEEFDLIPVFLKKEAQLWYVATIDTRSPSFITKLPSGICSSLSRSTAPIRKFSFSLSRILLIFLPIREEPFFNLTSIISRLLPERATFLPRLSATSIIC